MRGFRTFLLCAIAAILWLTPAAAVVYESVLVGSGGFNLGSIPLHAEALLDEGVWTYTYTATITGVTANVTGFSVGNLEKRIFADADNNKNFQNPEFSGTDSIFWHSGSVPASDGPIVFSFTSPYSPSLVDATMWGGYKASYDYTLGPVPEPGIFAGLVAFGLGSAGLFYRRRSGRR